MEDVYASYVALAQLADGQGINNLTMACWKRVCMDTTGKEYIGLKLLPAMLQNTASMLLIHYHKLKEVYGKDVYEKLTNELCFAVAVSNSSTNIWLLAVPLIKRIAARLVIANPNTCNLICNYIQYFHGCGVQQQVAGRCVHLPAMSKDKPTKTAFQNTATKAALNPALHLLKQS